MVDGPSSPFDSGVDPEAVASVAGSIEIANEVVVPGAVMDVVDVVGATVVDVVPVVDVVGATVVDVVPVVDVVGATVVDVVPVVDVVGATVVDAVVAGSATGSGTVDPHANPVHASTATTRTANVTRRTAPLTGTTIDGSTLKLPFQPWSGLVCFGSDHHSQAAYRPRDVAKQRELLIPNNDKALLVT